MIVDTTRLPIGMVLIALTLLTIVAIVVAITSARQKDKIKRSQVLTSVALATILFLTTGYTAYITTVASEKGMTHNDEWYKTTLKQIMIGEKLTPDPDKIPEDLNGKIIVMYKWGCPACEDTHKELDEALKEYDEVYYILSTSKEGKQLVKDYNIEYVPSILYVSSTDEYYKSVVAEKTDTEQWIIKRDVIEEIEHLRGKDSD